MTTTAKNSDPSASPEIDQESVCSSEETESPRSVGRWRRKKDEFVHSQVLRLRLEDSNLGVDYLIGVPRDSKLSAAAANRANSAAALSFVLFSRPVLPCSPLGAKNSSLDILQ